MSSLVEYTGILVSQLCADGSPEAAGARDRIDVAVQEAVENFIEKMREHSRSAFGPILDVVGALPKDELASMAESLVNLTAFKRRISMDAETVGGPIDVAVISKGDGFVWIKRKHYFRSELNPHFLANYFRVLEERGEV